MAIITLTTDFGLKDHFVGALKGAIYSELPGTTVVDISHLIAPFHALEAAYIIQNAYKSFPPNSVHIIGVDSELNPENTHIAVLLDEHYFICANNGILSLLSSTIAPKKIVEINIHDKVPSNFPVLDVFVKVATHIARGGSLDVIGKPITAIKPLTYSLPFVNDTQTQLIGRIIYIDNFGNLITNISASFFEKIRKGRTFEIHVRNHKFKTISTNYSAIVNFNIPKEKRQDEGKGVVLFNSSNYLEIALYKGSPNVSGGAASLIGLQLMDTVTVTFNET